MYTIVLGCVLGIAITLSILFPFISQANKSIAQSQRTSSAQTPPYVILEGTVDSYNPATRELIIRTPAPYDISKELLLSIRVAKNALVAHAKERYGQEGPSVVYGSEDTKVDASTLFTGQPILISFARGQTTFSLVYIRTFTPII